MFGAAVSLFDRLARRAAPRPRVLIIDDWIPDPRIGAGTPRALAFARAIIAAGSPLTILPTAATPPGIANAERLLPQLSIASGYGHDGLADFLAERGRDFDLVIVSRPHNMKSFRAAAAPAAIAAAIYDAEALFAMRDALRHEISGRPMPAEELASATAEEIALARGTRMVLAVDALTAQVYRAAGHRDVRVLGHAAAPCPGGEDFDARDGLLFVGPSHEDGTPNADSLIWFIDRVLPGVRHGLGREVPFVIAGVCRAPQIVARADHFTPLGPLDDLTAIYAKARVFVAPTRFASGIPIKVHEAAARGIPAVITPLLADQLGWRHEREALVAAAPEDFAAQCLRLHQDAALWRRLRGRALDRVMRDCDPRRFGGAVAAILTQAAPAR